MCWFIMNESLLRNKQVSLDEHIKKLLNVFWLNIKHLTLTDIA